MRPFEPVAAAFAAVLSVAALTTSASAGDWRFGCGACGSSYGYGQVFQAAPTYSYAPPTITVVPNIVVQPNYIVRRTYVVRPTQIVEETPSCFVGCGGGYVVNQGQYGTSEYSYGPVAGYRTAYRRHRYGGYRRPHYGYRSSYQYRHRSRGW
jgi:hypothetical protein